MKTRSLFGALTLAGALCQPPAAHAQPQATSHRVATRPTPRQATTAAPSESALLRQCDMTDLLQSVPSSADDGWGTSVNVLNGYFGPDHYRTELVLLRVRRDARQPAVYHVQGKSRYKKAVTSLSGTITLTQVAAQSVYAAAATTDGWGTPLEGNKRRMYTATGTFELREAVGGPDAGVCRGTVAVDFAVGPNNKADSGSRTSRTPTQGGGIAYTGTWAAAGTSTQVVWVANIFSYRGPQALTDLLRLGERTMSFNPKYASLGWNNYWSNDEWWADKPVAGAAL